MSIVNVQVDLSEIDAEDLIEEIERRDYRVLIPGEIDEDVEALHRTLDEIQNLYHAYLHWKDFGNKNENFERELKDFFDTTLDKVVL
jgi:hypothetical protein